jgi:hypothetical protein
MRQLLVLLVLTFTAITALAESMTVDVEKRDRAESVVVNCDEGHSLNSAISKLNKQIPNTVTVQGTCTEYVTIAGFENLTVKSTTGATLVQPSVIPTNGFTLLSINSSRSVTIDGLNFNSDSSQPPAIGIGAGSNDVKLRNLSIVGGSVGIIAVEHSQVSISGVTVKNAGWAYVAAVDQSQLEVEGCLLEESTGTGWHQGIYAEASHVRIWKTTIRDMQVGLHSGYGSQMLLVDGVYGPTGGVADVVIDNPSGTNFNGAVVEQNSFLGVSSAKLRILNAGQVWAGGDTGGIKVSGSSSLWASTNLIISGSRGQGVFVSDNSHAELMGSSITGSQHGGIVAVDSGTIHAAGPTPISGNTVDVFCDTRSVITGSANITNAKVIYCSNLVPGDIPPVP